MPAVIEFLDMAVSVTPPSGHFEPVPLTLGTSWQQNDVRIMFVSAEGANDDVTLEMPMSPSDPPATFTAAYSINPGYETRGAYYRYLQNGDSDQSFALPKPPNYREFMMATLTARGVSPVTAPIAGKLSFSNTLGGSGATITSVTVPAAGVMVFFVGTMADPSGNWPSWASSMDVPASWLNLVATDKSGGSYYSYDTNPGLVVIGKKFSSSGSTGSVLLPVAQGSPAFAGIYMFLQPAPDVSISVGAA